MNLPEHLVGVPQTFSDRLQLGTWHADLVHDRIIWSRHLYVMMGIRREDFAHHRAAYLACVHPDDQAHVEQTLNEAIAQASSFGHEYRILHPQRGLRWLRTLGDVILDDQGHVIALEGVCQDITDEMLSKQALSDQHAYCSKLFSITRDLIFVHPMASHPEERVYFERVNPAVIQTLGYSENEILKLGPWDLVSEDEYSEIEHEMSELQSKANLTFQKWILCKNGEKKLFEMHTDTFVEDGITKAITIARSLHERQQQQKLQDSLNQRLHAMVQLSQTPFESEDALIAEALEFAVQLSDSKIGYFHFVNEDQESLSLGMWSSDVHKHCTTVHDNHYPLSQAGIWADCARLKKPVIHNDYGAVSNKKGLPEGHIHLERHMSLPILEGDQVRVILGVGNKQEPYNETDIQQLQILAEYTWKMLVKHRAEQENRQQKQLYQSLVQSIAEGLIRVDVQGQIQAYNAKALEILELSAEQLLTINYRSPIVFETWGPLHVDGRPYQWQEYPIEICFQTGIAIANQIMGTHRQSGDLRWLKLHLEPVKNRSGDTEAIVITFEDITDKHLHEQQLIVSQQILSAIFENTIQLKALLAPDGTILNVNRIALEMIGSSKEQLVGKSFITTPWWTHDPRQMQTLQVAFEKARLGQAFQSRVTHRDRDQNLRVIDFNLIPLFDTHQSVSHILATGHDITDLEHSLSQLKSTENQLRTLISNLPGFVYISDVFDREKVLFVSEGVHAITGYSASELLQGKMTFTSLISPEYFDVLQHTIHKAVIDHQTFEMVYLIDRPDGSPRWILERGSGVYNDLNEALYIESFISDITNQKQTEIALQRATQMLESAQSLAQMGHWEWYYPDGDVFWSPELYRIFESDEIYSSFDNFLKLVHPEDQPIHIAAFQKMMAHPEHFLQTPMQLTYRFVTAKGNIKYLHSQINSVFDSEHQLTGFFGVFQDVTQQRQLELELERLNRHLDQEVQLRTVELIDVISNLNARMQQIQLLNQIALILQVHQPLEQIQSRLHELIQNMFASFEVTLEFERMPQTLLNSCQDALYCMPIQLERRRVGAICLIRRTASEAMLKQHDLFLLETTQQLIVAYLTRDSLYKSLLSARQLAEQASHSKSLFLANMSHEIRTPMNAILGFSQLLQEQIHDPQHQMYLDTIRHSGEALLRLINDVLDLSKIEAGKLELHLTPTQVKQLLKDTYNLFVASFEHKNIRFEILISGDVPEWCLLDGIRVQQILLNFLGNALKFTEHGEVKLCLDVHLLPDQTYFMRFQVKDTGPGLSDEDQARLFQPFEQGKQQRNQGTGLGLAISRQLAELMSARLSVESQEGHGSTFSLSFDQVKAVDSPQIMNVTAAVVPENFLPARILVADDVESNRVLTQGFLTDFPFEIDLAENGLNALQICEKNLPDLILMDIKMPIMDGKEALQKLRESPRTEAIPVIALTAFGLNHDQSDLLKQGFDAYLSKPLQKQDLLHLIERFLPQKRHLEYKQLEPPAQWSCTPQMAIEFEQLYQDVWLPQWQELQHSYIVNEIEAFLSELEAKLDGFLLPDLVSHFGRIRQLLSHLQIEEARESLVVWMQELKNTRFRVK